MTSRLLWYVRFLLLLALPWGCSENTQLVNVSVDGLKPDVAGLAVLAAVDGRSFGEQQVSRRLDSFVLRLPMETTGTLTLGIKGLSSDGCSVAEGSTSATLQPGIQTVNVTLTSLSSPSCVIEVAKGSTGSGQIRSTEIGIACGTSCLAVVPPGRMVTLEAQPDPGSYFAGWSGGCVGTSATCTLLSPRDGVRVVASFAPAQRCSPGGFCWQNPLPAGDSLIGLHGLGPNDAWIVGAAGVILHFNGTFWVPQPSPVATTLRGVWGSASDNYWFVGDSGTIVHWDGKQYRIDSATTQNLYAVFGTAADDVYAAGDQGTIVHFDGTRWTPLASGTTQTLLGIGGTDRSDVWFVGEKGTRLHWDGKTMSSQSQNTTDKVVSVWARAKNDVWAVGGAQQDLSGSTPHGVVWHYDGSTWTQPPVPNVDLFRHVYGIDSGDVWVIGLRGQILRYHNMTWIPYEGSVGTALWSVWGAGPDDVFAVGEGGVIVHWNGAFFSPVTAAAAGTQDLLSIWGSGPKDIWVVGNDAPLLHHDGSSWTTPAGALPQRLASIYGFGASDIWAVGDNGRILHYDGSAWSALAIPALIGTNLLAVWGTASNDLWITCDDGRILHRSGASIFLVKTLPVAMRAIWGTSKTDIWFAGDASTIAHSDGTNVVSGSLGGTQRFVSIWGSGPNDIWAVGTLGMIARNQGSGFTLQSNGPQTISPQIAVLSGIWGSGPNDVWVGAQGPDTVFRYDGQAWKRVDTISAGLTGVWGSGTSQIWAVGISGAIVSLKR